MRLSLAFKVKDGQLTIDATSGLSQDSTTISLDALDESEAHMILTEPDYSKGRRPPSRNAKRRSERQERKLAEDFGGRTQPGSGNQPGAKGDVRKRGSLRAECKFTQAKQYTIKRQELDKIRGEAIHGELPILQVEFQDSAGRPEDRWVLLPYDSVKDLLAGL